MDIPGEGGGPDEAVTADAPYGINEATGRPYTKSPEERAAIGAQLAAARRAKAEARQSAAAAPDPGQAQPIDRSAPDREPGKGKPRRGRRGRPPSDPDAKPEAIPPFKAGPIAKGMNRLYAKAGRLVRMVHPMFGEAIIATTRKESDDDETVGEAWEALAQVNPVWRGRLLKICTGGAYGRLVMAHAPILLALLMLEPVARRIPFAGALGVVLDDDDSAAGSTGAPTGADVEAMMAMATQMMGPLIAQRAPDTFPRTATQSEPGWYAPPAEAEAAAA